MFSCQKRINNLFFLRFVFVLVVSRFTLRPTKRPIGPAAAAASRTPPDSPDDEERQGVSYTQRGYALQGQGPAAGGQEDARKLIRVSPAPGGYNT